MSKALGTLPPEIENSPAKNVIVALLVAETEINRIVRNFVTDGRWMKTYRARGDWSPATYCWAKDKLQNSAGTRAAIEALLFSPHCRDLIEMHPDAVKLLAECGNDDAYMMHPIVQVYYKYKQTI